MFDQDLLQSGESQDCQGDEKKLVGDVETCQNVLAQIENKSGDVQKEGQDVQQIPSEPDLAEIADFAVMADPS